MGPVDDGAAGSLPSRATALEVLGFVVAINVIGASPALVFSPDSAWFRSLEKPAYYPPELAFPVAWTLLFTLMGLALWRVWRSSSSERNLALGLFGVQMALNVLWTPVFFGIEALGWALAVIVILWVSIVGTIGAFARVDRRAALMLAPYLLWVSFATVLSYELWRLNI